MNTAYAVVPLYALKLVLTKNYWGQEAPKKFDCNFCSNEPNFGAMYSTHICVMHFQIGYA